MAGVLTSNFHVFNFCHLLKKKEGAGRFLRTLGKSCETTFQWSMEIINFVYSREELGLEKIIVFIRFVILQITKAWRTKF